MAGVYCEFEQNGIDKVEVNAYAANRTRAKLKSQLDVMRALMC